MGLRYLLHTLREEDLEQQRIVRYRGQLRHRAEQEKAAPPSPSEEIPTFDLGGRTFEDRQSAAAFSTLVGRSGLKGKVLEHVPPSPVVLQDGRQPARLRDRTTLEERFIPGGGGIKVWHPPRIPQNAE
ncbi:MAG: hypothetical protein EXS64_21255 [Candidatus Latescibacteria bacterium]|nr:hypothetical protein [Candidatus Latescibacterota bacterium]